MLDWIMIYSLYIELDDVDDIFDEDEEEWILYFYDWMVEYGEVKMVLDIWLCYGYDYESRDEVFKDIGDECLLLCYVCGN